MAKKRMFSLDVIDLDSFIEMPISAKLLYYDLGMRADDDGFINSPKKIMISVEIMVSITTESSAIGTPILAASRWMSLVIYIE